MLGWIALGLFVMGGSYQLGLGSLRNPGPGLMPFLLGLLLCLTSLYILVAFLLEKMDRGAMAAPAKEVHGRVNFAKLSVVLGSLFVYSLVFETLGFLVTTFVILVVLFRTMNNRWFTVAFASALTAVIAYTLFTYLGVQFPKGILKGL